MVILARASVSNVAPAIAGFVGSVFSPLAAEAARLCLAQAERVAERTAVVIVSSSGDVGTALATSQAVDAGKRPGPLLFFQAVPNAVAGHIAAQHGLRGPVVCLSPSGRAVEPHGRAVEPQGRAVEAQGRAAVSPGRVGEAQGRAVEAQGRAAVSPGRVGEAHDRAAEAHDRAAEAEGLAVADLLIRDGDAEEALVICVEQPAGDPGAGTAWAVLVANGVNPRV
jgi:hypothetical protein